MSKNDDSRKQRSPKPRVPRNRAAAQRTPQTGHEELWASLQPDAKISARTFKEDGTPKRGEGMIFLRPGDGGPDPAPDPDDPRDPCRGLPFVRTPLVAAKLNLQSSQMQAKCPSTSDRQRIAQAVRSQFGRIIPNAEVDVPACSGGVLTVAVWSSPTSDPCELRAREHGLAALSLLDPGTNFGFFLNATLLEQQALRAFSTAPKQVSANGAPSPFGPIHLTGVSVEFQGPDRVRTIISGFDDRPWPDVNFKLILDDVIDENNLVCTSTSRVTSDSSLWVTLFGALLLSALSLFVPQLLPLAFFVLASDLQAGGSGNPEAAGIGRLALDLVPREVPLPARKKLTISYRRRHVNKGGLFFAGIVLNPVDRHPKAFISGPKTLSVAEDARSTSASYELFASDTFGNLTISWSSARDVLIESPSAPSTKVTFLRGNHTPDSPSFVQTITATVSDQDGFTQSVAFDVEIVVLDTESIPPICRTKPWLPQCQS